MRKDFIKEIEYIFPIIKDDYGNDFYLANIKTENIKCDGYIVISKTPEKNCNHVGYEEEAYYKTKKEKFLSIEKERFIIKEYVERLHSLEWSPKSITGYQQASFKDLNLVTRFTIEKI